MRYVRTTAPAADILSADEVKRQSVIFHGDDDALLTRLIGAVTSHLDGRRGVLGRALINQTWAASGRNVPCVDINGRYRAAIPLAPPIVSAITSVKYFDADNVQQTVSSSDYRLAHDDYGRAFVDFVEGYCPPIAYCREDAWQTVFVAGYGASSTDVPEAIRHGALLLISHWYENREAASAVSFDQLPMGVEALLGPYKVKTY